MLVAKIGIQNGNTVLDVGCGTGVLVPHLKAAIGEPGKITTIDFAANMIAQAAKKTKN